MLDIILAAVFVFAAVTGFRKGFLKSLIGFGLQLYAGGACGRLAQWAVWRGGADGCAYSGTIAHAG